MEGSLCQGGNRLSSDIAMSLGSECGRPDEYLAYLYVDAES